MSERKVLLLSSWYLPHAIIPWQAAAKMMYEQTIDVLASYDEELNSPSVSWKMPAVIRLRKAHRSQRKGPKFSRMNVYLRDKFCCQYCRKRFDWGKLSYDHVVPRSHGGRTNWTNIVTSCRPCNTHKANRTCDEAGMFPLHDPVRPKSLPTNRPLIEAHRAPAEWLPYLQAT